MVAYLDNSATTRVCDESIQAMTRVMRDCWGNPSSLHAAGIKAQLEFDSCRKIAAKALGCSSDEIYFTSGGTESNNLAVLGTANAMKRRGNRIVTTKIEHPSVLKAAKQLELQGFEVIYLDVGLDGIIKTDELFNAVNEKTVLVSVMAVNNEVSSIQPVEKIRQAVKRAGAPALFHTDCVQAFGKLPLNPSALGADLLSASSHKIHGPKGAGLLYVKKGTKISPILFGGEQQDRLRPGTEAMPAIAGFSAAIDALPNINEQLKVISSLRNYFLTQFKSMENVRVNSPENGLPYIINISMLGMRSETLLNFLSEKEIYVSVGSACAKGHRSYVLESLGLNAQSIDSAIRVSLSRFTQKQELDALLEGLAQARKLIRS